MEDGTQMSSPYQLKFKKDEHPSNQKNFNSLIQNQWKKLYTSTNTNQSSSKLEHGQHAYSYSNTEHFLEIQTSIEKEYLSLLDQIIFASDDRMNILYKNYHQRFFDRIISPIEDQINLEELTKKDGGMIDKCFKNTEETRGLYYTEINTMELLSKMIEMFDVSSMVRSADSTPKEDSSGKEVLSNIIKFIYEYQTKAKKMNEKLSSRQQQFQAKLANFTSSQPIHLKFSLSDIMVFLKAFFELEDIDLQTNVPLVLKFYTLNQIQIRFQLISSNGRFFMFTVLEDIKELIKISNLNTKVNYNHLLIFSLSHELHTPVHHLQNATEILSRFLRKQIPKTSKHFKAIEEVSSELSNEIQGLKLLVQNMLDFGQFLNKTMAVASDEVKVKDVIKEVMNIFSIKAKKKKLALNSSCSDELIIKSDREKLTGLLFIFLDNSVKYTLQGEVCINCQISPLDANYIKFEISDTGKGIEEPDLNILANIFQDPFSEMTTNSAAGIGIGFRMAQILLTYLTGGELVIDIKSKKNTGTVINFEILRTSETVNDDNSEVHYHMKMGKTVQLETSDPNIVDANQSKLKGDHLSSPRSAVNLVFDDNKSIPINTTPLFTPDNRMATFNFEKCQVEEKAQVEQNPEYLTRTLEPYIRRAESKVVRAKVIITRQGTRLGYRVDRSADFPKNTTEPIAKKTSSPLQVDQPQKKVALIVDDDVMNSEFLKEQLEQLGLEVHTAFDGELAIELCLKFLTCKKSVDIIFMDYSMPSMRGDECTKELRNKKFDPILKKTLIVGLTAHKDASIKESCLKSGMNMVEFKPFNYYQARTLLVNHQIIAPTSSNIDSTPYYK